VHGTGVRKSSYNKTLEVVKRKMNGASRSHIQIVECLWGDEHGVSLPNPPLSLPGDADRSIGSAPPAFQLDEWSRLYVDPLAELWELAQLAGGGEWDVPELIRTFRHSDPSSVLTQSLADLGVESEWRESRAEITNSEPFKQSAARAEESTWHLRRTVARAIAAHLISRLLDEGSVVPDDIRRDGWINQMSSMFKPAGETDPQCGVADRAISDFVPMAKGALVFGLQWLASGFVERQRQLQSGPIGGVIGDIILYQSPRGKTIRDFVEKTIRSAPEPRYVLAHSLGGIAAVDLLVTHPDLNVEHLITMGSQSPIFFEMNALLSLSREEQLPVHFPKWLNIFDPSDILSFLAKRAFHNDVRVTDRRHDSGQPLLAAHSAYWGSDSAWKHILEIIPAK